MVKKVRIYCLKSLNVTDFTTSRQLTLWKRELQSPQLDDVAEEVPVALVYNIIS